LKNKLGVERKQMSLLSNRQNLGHLVEAVVHFNRARDATSTKSSMVEVARTLFDGLNKLQSEWTFDRPDQEIGEVKSFQSMVLEGLLSEARSELLRSDELQLVLALQPQIMNHDVLRRRGYRPGVDLDAPLIREASEAHRKLLGAFSELDGAVAHIEDRVLKRLAELLYIVRSSIAHGEKTPYGPDLAKRDRDETVCSAIVPLQEMLFDFLLDHPARKFVVYGTLAPGQPNHHVIEGIAGNWIDCIVRGSVRIECDLPVFTWHPSGPAVQAQLFISADLPQSWSRIDAFEGSVYRRHLIPAKLEGEFTVANVYIGKRSDSQHGA
jgi:gamma-glutamylcyclotransferase (GGCT)/AIG2-like uncharacterized protein YtfP